MQEQTELVIDDIHLFLLHLLLDPLHIMCRMCITLSKQRLFTSYDPRHTFIIHKTSGIILVQSKTLTIFCISPTKKFSTSEMPWLVCWKTHQGHTVFWPILTYNVKFNLKMPVPWLHPVLYYYVTCTLTIPIKPKYYCPPVTGSFSQNHLHWKYSGTQTAGSENESFGNCTRSWTFSVYMVLWK